jgi:hypothetical protein
MQNSPSFDDDTKPKFTLRNVAIGVGVLVASGLIGYGSFSLWKHFTTAKESISSTHADNALTAPIAASNEPIEMNVASSTPTLNPTHNSAEHTSSDEDDDDELLKNEWSFRAWWHRVSTGVMKELYDQD